MFDHKVVSVGCVQDYSPDDDFVSLSESKLQKGVFARHWEQCVPRDEIDCGAVRPDCDGVGERSGSRNEVLRGLRRTRHGYDHAEQKCPAELENAFHELLLFGRRWICSELQATAVLVSSGYWFMTAVSPKALPLLIRVFNDSPTTCLVWSVNSSQPVRLLIPKAGLAKPSASLLLSGAVK